MLHKDVWLLLQDGSGKYGDISPSVKHAFFAVRSNLTKARQEGRKIALLIDSLGGDAKSAYQLATFLRRYCGGFVAVVPRFAKSAATLLPFGADEIVLGRCAELGSLDTQIYNSQRNGYIPVLDKVKALERLHASALEGV
jgi:ClpP class serine protease